MRASAKMLAGSCEPSDASGWLWIIEVGRELRTQPWGDITCLAGFPTFGMGCGTALTCHGCRGISSCLVLPSSSCGSCCKCSPTQSSWGAWFCSPATSAVRDRSGLRASPRHVASLGVGKSRSQQDLPLGQASNHLQGFASAAEKSLPP